MSELGFRWTDLRDAIRGLSNGRGTTGLAFIILSTTIAVATVVFSVVDAVVIRPLPFRTPERLVALGLPSAMPDRLYPPSAQDYFNWLEHTQAFEGLAASRPAPALTFAAEHSSEAWPARLVTANLFDVLGVGAAAGRLFGPIDQDTQGEPTVVLSHALWMRRFHGDADVIGRTIPFSQGARRVIGVLPAGVGFPVALGTTPDLYLPWVAAASERSDASGVRAGLLSVVGRLRQGITLRQARADVERTSSALVVPLHEHVVGPARRWLTFVLAGVGTLLLIACVNVGSLLLARSTARTRELAIREVLGASRRRLVGGVLLEALLLALGAGAVGVVIAFWTLTAALSLLPPGLTRISTVTLDGRVLLVCVVAAIVSAAVFGGAPALLSARSDLMGTMKAGGGSVAGNRRLDRSLSAFLVADIAFVAVLLLATALVVTSFIAVTTADLGFDRRDVLSVRYERVLDGVSPGARAAAAAAIRAELVARVKAVPGVRAAALTDTGTPLSGTRSGDGMEIPGYGSVPAAEGNSFAVTPEYFAVMGIQLIRGRGFQARDHGGAPPVMLINDIAAQRYFANRDAVGQVVLLHGPRTIVGIVQGTRANGPEADIRPEVYSPLDQTPDANLLMGGDSVVGSLVVRLNGDARAMAAAVQEAIRPALGGIAASQLKFVDDDFQRLTAMRRFNAWLMTTFGIVAVGIGATGIYGTVAFFVTQKTRSIGVRMALGATPAEIGRGVLRDALWRVGAGAGIGLMLAGGLATTLRAFVFGISPTEPWIYVAVGACLTLLTLFAALVPALRAARLSPVEALRHR